MKQTFFGLLLLLVGISCTNDKKSEANLHLSGTIKGLKKGTLYIQKFSDSTLVMVDSIAIDGKSTFESHLTIDSPEMLYLYLDKGVTNSIDNSLFVFAEPGNMTIETTLESFYKNVKVTGSKNHELYLEYKKINEPFVNLNLDLIQNELKASKLEQKTVVDSLIKQKDLMTKRRYLRVINFALNNKEYEVSPYVLLYDVYDANLKYLDSINNSYTEKIKTSKYGKLLKEHIEERRKEQSN
ncbi:DUF4369 domain-containing protein [Flavobacterium sp. UBA6135]|uniref:DUF4369 domain-containing protein n=1 Tax=Flavobacterium sp. UBA6135 TaxID=1946553 RepID=UPI0025BCD1F0|nr:DUF4369 domain-containing protein [Flavobacterium sp. UBA6135]